MVWRWNSKSRISERMAMRISIVIPCYPMHGVGVKMLTRALKSIKKQTFKDYEIVATDDSEDNLISELCDNYDVQYFRNQGKKGMASNSNFAMSKAKGELIKVLYQDDYFTDENSLIYISKYFDTKTQWQITACSNNPKPFFSKNENTLGSPSVLTIRNEGHLLFDEQFSWVLDISLYQRLFKKYGHPRILDKNCITIGIHEHQHTNHLTLEDKINEQKQLYATS